MVVVDRSDKLVWPGSAVLDGCLPVQAQASAGRFDVRRAHMVVLEATDRFCESDTRFCLGSAFSGPVQAAGARVVVLEPRASLPCPRDREADRRVTRHHGEGAGPVEPCRSAGEAQGAVSANEQHLILQELSGLLRKTIGLADGLVGALASVAGQSQAAFAFASMARATEYAGSDIDITVICDVHIKAKGKAKPSEIAKSVDLAYGLPRSSGKLKIRHGAVVDSINRLEL